MKKWLLFFLLLILVPFFLFYRSLIILPHIEGKKVFVINQGENLLTIGTRLQQNNYIKNKYYFVIDAYLLGLNQKIQAGTFYLNFPQKMPDLIKNLAKGGTKDYWFKIIPGTRLEQFSPDSEFTLAAKNLEGQLFPDSYLIPQYYSTSQILSIISNNFNKKIVEAKVNSSTNLTDTQTLILASLLEREGKNLTEKKNIAGILLNRLDSQMPLQLDASVQYARDSLYHPDTYWQPLSKGDLSIVSPYNTYKNHGLPPSPICNPSLDSLIAAYHPAKTDYVYYLHDNSGQIHYAKTLAEHNANIAKYLK